MSLLSLCPLFNIINGTCIDYMHCILLAIVKMLMGLWIDFPSKEQPWSIRASIGLNNEKFIKIQPPSIISRLPRNLEDYNEWKASEYRSFLLFYSLPLLSGSLPKVYYDHFKNLVTGIFLLLKSLISQMELEMTRLCFKHFCIGMENLYGERYATFNVHCLLHVCDKVKDLGPLWTQSCFFL